MLVCSNYIPICLMIWLFWLLFSLKQDLGLTVFPCLPFSLYLHSLLHPHFLSLSLSSLSQCIMTDSIMSKAATMEIPINSNGDTGTLAEDDSLEQVGHTTYFIPWLCGTSWDHPVLLFTYLKLLHKVCVYPHAIPKPPTRPFAYPKPESSKQTRAQRH